MAGNTPVAGGREPYRRWPLLILVAALLVGALIAVALVALLRLPPVPPALRVYRATQTAQTLQLSQPYMPSGIGPCDTADPPYSSQNASYWQWGSVPGDVTCGAGGVTQVTKDGYLAFYGFPAGFPASFMATVTLAFHSDGSGQSCLDYNLNSVNALQGFRICDNGQWQDTQADAISGDAGKADHYILVMRVTVGGVQFLVNGVVATPPFARGAITDISLDTFAGFAASARMDIERFTLVPTV